MPAGSSGSTRGKHYTQTIAAFNRRESWLTDTEIAILLPDFVRFQGLTQVSAAGEIPPSQPWTVVQHDVTTIPCGVEPDPNAHCRSVAGPMFTCGQSGLCETGHTAQLGEKGGRQRIHIRFDGDETWPLGLFTFMRHWWLFNNNLDRRWTGAPVLSWSVDCEDLPLTFGWPQPTTPHMASAFTVADGDLSRNVSHHMNMPESHWLLQNNAIDQNTTCETTFGPDSTWKQIHWWDQYPRKILMPGDFTRWQVSLTGPALPEGGLAKPVIVDKLPPFNALRRNADVTAPTGWQRWICRFDNTSGALWTRLGDGTAADPYHFVTNEGTLNPDNFTPETEMNPWT